MRTGRDKARGCSNRALENKKKEALASHSSPLVHCSPAVVDEAVAVDGKAAALAAMRRLPRALDALQALALEIRKVLHDLNPAHRARHVHNP